MGLTIKSSAGSTEAIVDADSGALRVGLYNSDGEEQSLNLDLDVSRNNVGGTFAVNVCGYNGDIDSGTEDLWPSGGVWAAPATAAIVNFTSASANDAAAGTGARTIRVTGLDGNYDVVTEDLTLNGTSDVPTTLSYNFISSVYVLTAGSGGTNAGIISGTSAAAGTPVLITIVAGKAESQLGLYQVPAGYSGFIQNINADMQGGTNLSIELYVKPFGGVSNLKSFMFLNSSNRVAGSNTFKQPLLVSEKSIVRLSVTSDASNALCSGSIQILLIANT